MSFNSNLVIRTDHRFVDREQPDQQLLDVLGVPQEHAQFLRVLDRKGPLALVHYLSIYTDDTKQTIDPEPLRHVGHVRGTIVDTETGVIVCRSFPHTPELLSSDPTTQELDVSKATVYHSCEGTVLRLFFHGDDWHLSTHRKINADDSYWSGPTFGSMYSEVRKFNNDTLNSDYCYIFLLSHPGNRLVFRIPEPHLMLIGVYNKTTQQFFMPETSQLDGVRLPEPARVSDTAELVKLVDTTAQRFDRAGVIIIPDMTNPRPVKVMSNSYHDLREARGNDPSLRSRYIQLRSTPAGTLLVKWYNEDEHQQVFAGADQEFDQLVRRIHSMYMNRYVHKQITQLPKEEFVTLQRCHSWHCEDRGTHKVTQARVREFLNGTPSQYLLRMLNRQRQLFDA